ncbi:hypothetical protein JCM11641_008460 [Rhodosporidiobolus odoratus]
MTDSWVPTASTCTSSLPVPTPSTPSKRASRSSRTSNDTDYSAFTRTIQDAGGFDHTATYRIGDSVIVNSHAKLKQKFLSIPTYLVPPKKVKGKKQQPQDEYDGWRHEDGLQPGDKVAVITRLFEDVRGRKMALVRWFARPGAVWGPEGPEEDEAAGDVLPYELYYTSDSTHLAESRLIRSRAALNPFSSPSASPIKSSRSPAIRSPARPTLSLIPSSSLISAAASFRTPQHSDPVLLSTITSHAQVFSPSALQSAGITSLTAKHQQSVPAFLCRTIYDVKPVSGAGFWGEVEWDELREQAVEVYRGAMEGEGGVKGEAQDGWDVEAVMEVDSEEEEKERERERERERRKKKVEKKKAKSETVEGKVKKVERGVEEVEVENESSSDEDEGEEDAFNPHRQAASDEDSGSGSEGEATGSDSEGEAEASGSDSEGEDLPRTPSKRTRRGSHLPTPTSSRRARSSPVKGKKRSAPAATARAAKRRRFASTANKSNSDSAHNPLPPLLSATHLATLTPFERAKALLHVSATPEALPCREDQRERIRQFIGDAVLGRTGGCLYVHGVPGTGKTATVHSVVRELQNDPDMDAFTFVEINGMKISEPMAAFSQLWSALSPSSSSTSQASPRKPSARASLSLLESHFSNPDPARKTTVVLVDELDQMLTKRQDVLYSFFNWPHVPHSRLVVVAVANTMDLPEREMSGKIRSRLGTNRIPFQPYTWTELKRILEARLSLVDPSAKKLPLFDDVALQKISKSVAGISGDARKALDVARRTLDRVALRLAKEGKSVDDAAAGTTGGGGVRCTIQDATQAYNDMTRQGPAVFVRRLGTMSKVLLLAVAQCVKRAGVGEVEVDTVLTWHLDFLRQTSLLPSSSSSSSFSNAPNKDELLTLLSELHALRLIATESQRLDVFQRVRAGVDEGDLFAALREDEVLAAHVPKVM